MWENNRKRKHFRENIRAKNAFLFIGSFKPAYPAESLCFSLLRFLRRYQRDSICRNKAWFWQYRLPSVVYQAVTEIIASSGGMIFHKAISTFLGSLIPSTRPIRLVRRMQCISDNSWFTEYIAHDQIGTFASYTREGEKSVKVTWNIVMVFSCRIFMHALMSLALLFPSPQGFYNRFNFFEG